MFNISYIRSLFSPKPSLAAELAAACLKVDGLMKVRGDKFAYLRIQHIADALRDELFSRGIQLFPDDREWWFDSWEQEGKRWTEAGVHTEITVSNGRETLTFASFGVGRDMDGHALAIAQTGALKAWLKRFGLLFGEYDDPEKEQGDIEHPAYPREVVRIASFQERAFASALHECEMTKDQAEKLISEKLGRAVTADAIMQLPRKRFDTALSILFDVRDQTADWQKSVSMARERRGGQPITNILDRKNGDEIGAD